MEIKCKICGTINDSNYSHCKGCCQPLQAETNNEKEQILSSIVPNNITEKSEINDNANYIDEKIKITEKSAIELYFKFILFYILFSIILSFIESFFTTLFKFDNIWIINLILSILTYVLSVNSTFKLEVPKNNKKDVLLLGIFLTMSISEIVIRCLSLYIDGFYLIYNYCLVSIVYLISSLILINYINYMISKNLKEKVKSNFIFIFNIIIFIVILGTLLFGIYAKNNDLNFNTLMFNSAVEEEAIDPFDSMYEFIDESEKEIMINMLDLNYQVPSVIDNVNFVNVGDDKIEKVNLEVSEDGTITSGEFIYDGKTYTYNGNKLVKK